MYVRWQEAYRGSQGRDAEGIGKTPAKNRPGGIVKKTMAMAIITVCLLMPSIKTYADDVGSSLKEATDAYSRGEYDGAEKIYRMLLEARPSVSTLHANLARVLYREGKLGEAIFEMVKAHNLNPRDAEINADLEYLRNDAIDQIKSKKTNIFKRAFDLIDESIGLSDAWILLVIALAFYFGALSIRIFVRRTYITWIVISVGLVCALFVSILLKKEFFSNPFGVVTAVECTVFSGPNDTNVVLFKLHEGAEFEITDLNEGGWKKILLADGKQGWIKKEDIVAEGQ